MTNFPILAANSCPACGADCSLITFTNEVLPLVWGSHTEEVDRLSGQRCAECGEVFLDDDSQERFVSAADALVIRVRQETSAQLRRVRRKLKLTQHEAAEISGGGHNAFSRYESGKAQPVQAVFHLFYLLDKHPDLLAEIRPTNITPYSSTDLAKTGSLLAGRKKTKKQERSNTQ